MERAVRVDRSHSFVASTKTHQGTSNGVVSARNVRVVFVQCHFWNVTAVTKGIGCKLALALLFQDEATIAVSHGHFVPMKLEHQGVLRLTNSKVLTFVTEHVV